MPSLDLLILNYFSSYSICGGAIGTVWFLVYQHSSICFFLEFGLEGFPGSDIYLKRYYFDTVCQCIVI